MVFRRAVVCLLLLLVPLAAVAAEVLVSDVVIRPAANNPAPPKIATNGRELLVVWLASPDDLRARRISAAGELLDPVGFHVARAIGSYTVASDGDGYLIAYTTSTATNLVRVERDGTVGTPTEMFPMASPALAWNGTTFLLAGDNQVTGVNVRTLRRDGTPLEPWRSIAAGGVSPAVSWNGQRYLVAWWRNFRTEAATIDGGTIGPIRLIAQQSGSRPPGLATNGDEWLIAWTVFDSGSVGREIRSRPIAADGTPLETTTVEVFGIGLTLASPLVGLTHNGTNYFLTWLEGPAAVRSAFLNPAGRMTHESSALAGVTSLPSAAAAGTTTWIAWKDEPIEIEARRLNDREPRPLAFTAGAQSGPSAIRRGAAELVAWSEQVGVDRKPTVFTARVTSAGPLDGEGIVAYPSSRRQFAPVLADGPEPLLLWSERTVDGGPASLVAKPFGSTAAPIVLGPISSGIPAVVWTGSSYLVAWHSGGLVAARVLPSGVVLDAAPIRLAEYGANPAIAFDGENVLLSWSGRTNVECAWGCIEVSTTEARLFSRDGIAIAPQLRFSQSDRTALSVAWTGSEFAAFWVALNGELTAARIARNGTKIGAPRTIGMFSNIAGNVPAVWTGADYALALPVVNGMRILRVSRELEVTRNIALDTDGENARPYSIVVQPGGTVAIAYERLFRDAPFGGAQRALVHYDPPRRRSAR